MWTRLARRRSDPEDARRSDRRNGRRDMRQLVLLALVGLGAQLVDGSLGMAYGVALTPPLFAVGTHPAGPSAAGHPAGPVMSLLLLVLGVYILVRFTTMGLPRHNLGKPLRKRFLGPLGLVAGFVGATGGRGWGAVGRPAIL